MKLISENKLSITDIAGTAPSMIEKQVSNTNFESFKSNHRGEIPKIHYLRPFTPTEDEHAYEDEVTEITPIREKIHKESFASNIDNHKSASHRRDHSARSAQGDLIY